eukprot:TRINITY_DN11457_c0_g2_i1.p1 TRINITY_DN11457_c0_g2~~TRINITY_DN11457_c0_g2_i1.p1  ORF type:complete len:833 (+),score=194.28 TRINITY_DN11457_c0_g2_i1:226-2724(+)
MVASRGSSAAAAIRRRTPSAGMAHIASASAAQMRTAGTASLPSRLATETAHSWADVMFANVDSEQFYAMDEFYTDAQYGDDFGYYSKGHVLLKAQPGSNLHDTQQFAHFTTYPMILSPHVGRVFCRVLFMMWVQLDEIAPFRVVEMGAGSGQLAYDIQQCVKLNDLGITPAVWRRWVSAFEYLIMERSPALAKRQRERGLRNVPGDAQSVSSCKPVLQSLAQSTACAGVAAQDAPECKVGERGTAEASASVVISNELLDAFAPVKLRFSLYGSPNITSCTAWQEVRLVHTIPVGQLRSVLQLMGHTEASIETMIEGLQGYTDTVFCSVANTTIGREARERVPAETSCMALTFGLSDLVNHVDLGVPAASHNMRLRIRKDPKLWGRLRQIVIALNAELQDSVAVPRDVYRQLRFQMRDLPEIEAQFLHLSHTYLVPVSINEKRCEELSWWFVAHKDRVARLAQFYRPLGYPALHLVVRPGEKDFIELVDCLVGPSGGFKLSLDYGANFEALSHSFSIDPKNDGIFVPPIPHELMQDLPECHNFWPKCAGRIDWTTFVDFTNLAAAGELLGWETRFYGPQSLLEQISRFNLTSPGGREYSVPGYSTIDLTWASRHVQGWYGHEVDGAHVQRWTSFKALLMHKKSTLVAASSPAAADLKPLLFPSWHLDTLEMDTCWQFDPGTVPLSDWIPRTSPEDPRKALALLTEEMNDKIGRDYGSGYEEAQLAVRLVDWLVSTGGCESLRPEKAQTLLNSGGLFQAFRTRLVKKWGEMWESHEALERVGREIIQRIADDEEADHNASLAACTGQQTFAALCENGAGGSIMSWRGRKTMKKR